MRKQKTNVYLSGLLKMDRKKQLEDSKSGLDERLSLSRLEYFCCTKRVWSGLKFLKKSIYNIFASSVTKTILIFVSIQEKKVDFDVRF